MKEFYSDTVPDPEKQSISGLLRPETNIRADGRKFARVYGHLWRSWGSTTSYYDSSTQGMRFKGKDVDSIEEVREAMEFLAARYTGPTVMLIGGHGHTRNDTGGRNDPMPSSLPKSGDGSTDEIGGELREILADEISDLLSKSAGYGDNLVEMAIKAIKANATMVRRLLEDFAATSEFNSFTRYMKHVRRRRSIFPRQLSRRDATMMGAGVIPIFYQTPRAHFSPQKDGMNVYIDVSGSMWSALPKVLGLLKASQKYLDGIYQFSNKVVPTTMRELFRCRGKAKISGTGGTDYNCIIDHAISIGARKIVILTDGYADCDVKRKNQCLANIDKACVIYAENHTKDEFWRKHYHRHYDLNELFKGC
jgi:hypothetical protein